jgi:hypothetical protein
MGHPARWFISAVAFALLVHSPQETGGQAAGYDLHAFCTGDVPSGQRTVPVANGAELQLALDRAMAGDVILLATGATFRPAAGEGSIVLRRRPNAPGSWITVRSADKAFDAAGTLPPSTRVDKTHVDLMAKIRATGSAPAIKTEVGAHGYRLIGIDVGADAAVSLVTNLVELGSGRDTSIDAEPSDIIIDRSYLHGNDSGSFRRGVAMNGVRLAVVDSYLENFHDANGDSQAIAGWNGPGPFTILRNVLEAASENVMFGGADPAIPDLVPADIEVRGNLMTKRVAWKAAGVPVKNAFELKTARRVVVDGNTFEHVWASGQDGTAIVLKSVNQEGNCAWCVTEYVTFSNNIVTDAAHGVMINAVEVGAKGLRPPVAVNHVRLQNVLFQEIGGKLFRIMGGASDVAITHVTSLGSPSGILDPRDPNDRNPGLVFEHNIVERKFYGIGTGADEGSTTLTRNFSPFTYNNNVLVNTSRGTEQAIADEALKARYPKSTAIAPAWTALGFQQGSYQPSAGNRYATGERRPGVDMDALRRAQQGSGSPGCGAAPKSAAQPPKP